MALRKRIINLLTGGLFDLLEAIDKSNKEILKVNMKTEEMLQGVETRLQGIGAQVGELKTDMQGLRDQISQLQTQNGEVPQEALDEVERIGNQLTTIENALSGGVENLVNTDAATGTPPVDLSDTAVVEEQGGGSKE